MCVKFILSNISNDTKVFTRYPTPTPPLTPPYPTSAGHFAFTSTTSNSEQRMVSELVMSLSDSSPPQQQQARRESPLWLPPCSAETNDPTEAERLGGQVVSREGWSVEAAVPKGFG